MTVKCVTDANKRAVVYLFKNGMKTLDELAHMFHVSRRTVIRVLEENGIDPGIRRRMPKPTPIPTSKQVPLPTGNPTHIPWYRRIIDPVVSLFQ